MYEDALLDNGSGHTVSEGRVGLSCSFKKRKKITVEYLIPDTFWCPPKKNLNSTIVHNLFSKTCLLSPASSAFFKLWPELQNQTIKYLALPCVQNEPVTQ